MFTADWAEREMRPIMAILARKWVLAVVVLLTEEPRRPRDLRRAIEGISDKVLTAVLRALEHDGLVRRDVYATVPAKVEYALTPLGRSLEQPLATIARWVAERPQAIETAHTRSDQVTFGEDPSGSLTG